MEFQGVVSFVCPHLGGPVELTRERERHILRNHPEVLPDRLDHLARTLADPDEIRIDPKYARTRLFIRRFEDLLGGKNLVVAVVSGETPVARHWIVTAHIARRPARGGVEWKRN